MIEELTSKKLGKLHGSITSSCNAYLAISSPATLLHFMFGFSLIITESRPALSFACSGSSASFPTPPFDFVFGWLAIVASPLGGSPTSPIIENGPYLLYPLQIVHTFLSNLFLNLWILLILKYEA